MRPTDQKDIWEFVADANSNTFIPLFEDTNYNGIADQADENVAPGVRYFNDTYYSQIFKGPTYSSQPYRDQWGVWISGLAPIKSSSGIVIGFLGIDAVFE